MLTKNLGEWLDKVHRLLPAAAQGIMRPQFDQVKEHISGETEFQLNTATNEELLAELFTRYDTIIFASCHEGKDESIICASKGMLPSKMGLTQLLQQQLHIAGMEGWSGGEDE